jgi:hypothetical protein
MFIPIPNLEMDSTVTIRFIHYEDLTNMTKIYMHTDLNFKLVRIIYTLREKKNVFKHVVEGYTIYLKIIMQRDGIRLKR